MSITDIIRCVIYCRFSSEMQKSESIASQLRLCREHAARKGYVVVGVYQDEAKTGTNDSRDQFQEMMESLLAGKLQADVVLCWKFERLWRDTDMPGYYRYQLRQVGVRVESVSLQIDRRNPMSIWLQQIDQAQAAHFSVNLAIETTRGQTQNALQARSSGGRPVLGYKLVPADPADPRAKPTVYEIDPRGAAAVRLIFARYAAGARLQEIVDELNAAGYRTNRGRLFKITSIHELLHNEKYIGVYEYRAWKKENAGKRSTGHMYEADEQVIRIEDGVPAIIDRATWEAVQARLQAGRHVGRAHTGTVVYLLSGLVLCGTCGQTMHGDRRTKTNAAGEKQAYPCYVCRDTCRPRSVGKAWLEGEVIAALEEHVFSEDGRVEITRALLVWRADYLARRQDLSKDVQRQLQQAEKELDRLIDGITQGVPVTDRIKARITQLEAERSTLKAQLDAPIATPPADDATIHRGIEAIRHGLTTADDRTRQQLLAAIVESVVIHPDRVDVAIAFIPPNKDGRGVIPRRQSVGMSGARDWNPAFPTLPRVMVSFELARKNHGVRSTTAEI
jgi:site-specific DNA recombinase